MEIIQVSTWLAFKGDLAFACSFLMYAQLFLTTLVKSSCSPQKELFKTHGDHQITTSKKRSYPVLAIGDHWCSGNQGARDDDKSSLKFSPQDHQVTEEDCSPLLLVDIPITPHDASCESILLQVSHTGQATSSGQMLWRSLLACHPPTWQSLLAGHARDLAAKAVSFTLQVSKSQSVNPGVLCETGNYRLSHQFLSYDKKFRTVLGSYSMINPFTSKRRNTQETLVQNINGLV